MGADEPISAARLHEALPSRIVFVLTPVPAEDDELEATVRFVLLPLLGPPGPDA